MRPVPPQSVAALGAMEATVVDLVETLVDLVAPLVDLVAIQAAMGATLAAL